MKNYYNFNNLYDDSESINYYNSLFYNELNNILNICFDDINYFLTYYAEFLRGVFSGSDYDEHYYRMMSLAEELNDIKIILNIMKDKNEN